MKPRHWTSCSQRVRTTRRPPDSSQAATRSIMVDLPAPKKAVPSEPSESSFDPFADMDLPAPLEAPGGADLPAPLASRGGSEIDLPAPMRGSAAPAADPFAGEVDLPMAMTDAELPKPMPLSNVPEPISLDSDFPIASDEQDLPVARDDFAEVDAPPRKHGGGPIELDLPDGADLDLEGALGVLEPVAGIEPPGAGVGREVVGERRGGGACPRRCDAACPSRTLPLIRRCLS